MTIKNKIFLSYVLLLIVPLLVITLINYWTSKDMIEKKSVDQFYTVSQLANRQFDQYFMDIENLSMNIFQGKIVQKKLSQPLYSHREPTIDDFEQEKEMTHFLRGIYKLKPGISSILIYGYNGRNYYYHPKRSWNAAYDATREPWFKHTVAKGGAWVLSGRREEKQLYNKFDRRPEEVVTFSRVIKSLQSFEPIGVLAINVKIETLENLAGVNTGPNKLIIYDQDGKPVVASTGFDPRLQGNEFLQVSTVSPYTRWKSAYFASKDVLIKESRQMRNFMMFITVLLLVLASVLAHFISAGIVKPLRRLKAKMKAVERGEFNSREEGASVRNDEIGELTYGFNHMLERIEMLVEEIRRQEQQKREAELSALQARINPHFMYNTLNGLRWAAMMEGNHRIAGWITSFVYLLKFSAKNQDALITLQQELELLRHYVELMKMRNDQFDFRLQVDDNIRHHLVVPFLLQPIVENAIFHGIVPSERKGVIEVNVYCRDRMNVAVIRDNGVGIEEEKLKTLLLPASPSDQGENFNKIGLSNVSDRLRLKFGLSADLQVKSRLNEGTEVIVVWPVIGNEKEEQPDEESFAGRR
ncbi:cache domain-containing sensor histidine kinase [Lihuaxuella thermophila]|uniref:Two-component system, sensor histidine kinase YesM n=1 Tax=Lihuaxuella thermophila TaxID=1173111 RepID=A0A1H8CG81_9BACL|nr:sensor histidine kinase [Lihuaxuella thermophila]SEM94016.1 two-component system, sensor histidine kinase YesM [Lihuaxuella thermophila]